MNKQELIMNLHDIGVIKTGKFELKSGQVSPIYIDLREIIAYPKVLQGIATLMWQETSVHQFDVICGVPYTALPFATCMSVDNNMPMLIQRKEVKAYGTKKRIEGKIIPGQHCLIVEDVVTTGGSVLETKKYLEDEGLVVTDVVVAVNREQGAIEKLAESNLRCHALMSLSEILALLKEQKGIEISL